VPMFDDMTSAWLPGRTARVVAPVLACAALLLAGEPGSGGASGASSGGRGGPRHGGALMVDVPTGPENLNADTSNDNESIWALQDWTNDIVDPDEYTAFTLCGSHRRAAACTPTSRTSTTRGSTR
jgi:hypothetical protein